MANTVFCQHRFKLRVGDFIPQRLALHLVGIDIPGARNMAQQIQLRRAPCGFKHFPFPGRGGGHRFTLLKIVQPLRIHQLLKMRQLLQALRLAQGIAKRAEMSETCGLKARRDFRVVVGVAVQRNRR